MDGEPRDGGNEKRKDKPAESESRRGVPGRNRRGLLKTAGAVLCAGASGHIGRVRKGPVIEARQVSETDRRNSDHSLLFWNTWLLDGILGIGDATRYEARAEEVGQAIGDIGYDIVALCEVFDADEREAVERGFADGIDNREGPEGGCLEVSSGLYTLLPDDGSDATTSFVSSDKTAYSEDGQEVRDADALSRKGVLHTEIDVGPGNIDLFSTHLLAGGGLGFFETLFGWLFPDVPDRVQRESQVSELTDFVKGRTKEKNITVVAGDFNIEAGTEEYRSTIGEMMEELELYDGWLRHGSGAGPTNAPALTAGCDIDESAGLPYRCGGEDRGKGDRIDYVFVEEPKPAHTFELDVSGMERATFWRGKENQERLYADDSQQVPNYMSDHMALELHFDAVPK
jgi:endonuclease/exonuclease/phosphatase family metal-dependent hydrolase